MSDHNPPNKRLKRVGEEPMSDNNTPQIKHDVFVSFRGEIRDGFLSHLIEAFKRSQINAFIDDELKRGDEIWPSLVEAIERSSISLIIFSPDYASSCWCLEEIMKILECRKKHGQIVIPVFYKVEPTDVGHQSSESYKNAFVEHARKYETTKVKNWSDALKTSAKISGIASSKFPVDAELVKEIVNRLLQMLDKPSVNSKKLVGIDEKIATIESLIGKEPKDTRLIGIWGMGGMGKTTLAEVVFNKLRYKYEGSYFLADERDQSNKFEIISLKENIFSKLLGYDVKIHTPNSLPEDIVRRIGCMKVFIVLDDVNDPNHIEKLLGTLDNFGLGSRIIVTTRNRQVLKANKADEEYQLRELNSNEALVLFNLYAFNQSDHQREYNDLLERVVHYGQGIPLILRVLAGLLRGNEKEVWESELNKLKKVPPIKVYDVLEWSYNDLDRKQQQIFLDLACFFLRLHTAVNVGDLKSLLKDGESDNSVIVDLKRLEDRALITFSKDNSLQEMPQGNHRRESSKDNFVYMHDSLQEVAWEIVRRESSEPGSRSRLWDPDDIYEALKNNKGTAAIRSIQIQLSTIKKQKLSPQIFAKMSKLQFLEISGKCNDDLFDQHCILAKGLRFLATELKFLYWDDYPLKSLPKKFSAERLVILSLRHSSMEKLWDGVKNLVNLKEVDLSHSEMLKELPNLSKATNLEELILGGCSMVKALPSSFGHQSKLGLLDLSESGIERLPSSISNLTQLLYLDVSYCSKLQILPELARSLETLNVRGCGSLKTLPELPRSLQTLEVRGCRSLKTLPELPRSLESLDVRGCRSLRTLPEPPRSLETLDVIDYESIETLPELPQSLKTLNVNGCKSLQILPKLPQSLKTLHVRGCESLQTLPELPRSLETLDVTNCESIETLPELPRSLETLDVMDCESIETLPELPQSLKTLNVIGCESLQTLPELPRSLETLDVTNYESIETPLELPRSLETLPELPQSLKILKVNGYKSLQTLPELHQSLETLHVTNCESIETLPELPLSLETLDVTGCESIGTLPELPQSLKTLNVNGCKSLQTVLELPWSLENLDVKFCYKLQILPKLPLSLKTLNVESCSSLQILPKLPLSLEALNVRSCISLKTVLFPSIAVEQLKENRKRVMFWNCLNLDEDSLVAIGLNAQINLMKFANQHLSAPNHDHVENYNDYGYGDKHRSYQAVYMYPGSSVAEWLEYKTTNDYIIIDLSSPPPSPKLGFIICFVLGKDRATEIYGRLEVNLIISDADGEGKKDSFAMFVHLGDQRIGSDHVCVMYDQICSDFLSTIAKNQTSFKIQVQSIRTGSLLRPQEVLVLKGFGVSPMSTSAYSSFIQQMELRDSMLQFH